MWWKSIDINYLGRPRDNVAANKVFLVVFWGPLRVHIRDSAYPGMGKIIMGKVGFATRHFLWFR